MYVPGCPPRPDAVIDALLKLQKIIEREHPLRRVLGPVEAAAPSQERGSGLLEHQPNAAVERSARDLHPHDPRARGGRA